MHCIHRLFESEVEKGPGRVALVHGPEEITYAELNRRANRLAHHLMSLDLDCEALVGLMMERSPDVIVAILGILKAGCAYLPLDTESPPDRLALMIEDADLKVVLTRSSFPTERRTRGPEWISLDELELHQEACNNPDLAVDGNNLAYVMFTSGSTGRPKGVMIEHRSVVRLVKNTDYAKFDAENIFLQFAPVTFDASTFEIWGALLNGGRLVIMPAGVNSLSDLGTAIREHGVTTLWLTAGLFHLMVDERIEELSSLRQLLAGGDVLSVPHVQKALSRLNCDLINGYGPTENTTFTCCYKVPRDIELGGTIPIGQPIANTQVYILDENMTPVPEGEIGELYVGGEGVARGYLNHDGLTAERFVVSPHPTLSGKRLYRTGDLARCLPDKNIDFIGRVDNQVKIRGFRVELEEIEAAVIRQAGVRQAVAVTREISAGDKQLVAFVVADPDGSCDRSEIKRHLEGTLPEYMVPMFIFPVDELPLTSNGKVDRLALLRTIPSGQDRGSPSSVPDTEIERMIAAKLEGILNTGPVGTDDNFFDLGASSLQLASLHSRLQAEFGKDLRITTLFQFPTVRTLAQSLGPNHSVNATIADLEERGLRQRAAYGRRRKMHAQKN